MKVIVQDEYGSPSVLRLAEVEKPAIAPNEVLVKVHAAGVHAGDWHLMRGTPVLIRLVFGGLFKPKFKTIGTDMAGQVEAVGEAVSQFQPGDQVFADLSESGFGAFAEYVAVSETALALKPANLTFTQAATVPVSALAALQALRDYGDLCAGQTVLINGASGGVGSFAVQIAKAFGAEVTGVCSTQKIAMVRSLGADHIVDYTQTDCTQMQQRYDVIVDAAAYRSVKDFLPILTQQGVYVMVGGATPRLFQAMWLAVMNKQIKTLVSSPNQADLTVLKTLIEENKISPVVDRCYSLSEVPDAIRYVEQRQVQGKVAISI
ncbi:MAG: NAD(P)-dependent alcohol dehydrogenase [Cyanobacteria bacterium P01_D01_bin.105]